MIISITRGSRIPAIKTSQHKYPAHGENAVARTDDIAIGEIIFVAVENALWLLLEALSWADADECQPQQQNNSGGIELHGLPGTKQEVRAKSLGELLAASLTPMTPALHNWHPQPSNEFVGDALVDGGYLGPEWCFCWSSASMNCSKTFWRKFSNAQKQKPNSKAGPRNCGSAWHVFLSLEISWTSHHRPQESR